MSEPWKAARPYIAKNSFRIEASDGSVIASGMCKRDDHLSRIVACVNACADASTDELVSGAVIVCGQNLISYFDNLRQKRDELLELLKAIQSGQEFTPEFSKTLDETIARIEAK